MNESPRPTLATIAEGIFFFGMLASWIVAIGVVGAQILFWLKSGAWVPAPSDYALSFLNMNLRDTWPYVADEWLGAAEVVRWLLDIHVSVHLLITVPVMLRIISAFITRS